MQEVLKENEILEIKGDRIFHDLWNEHEMDTIEWTVMQILECRYSDIHGKVKVGNIRLTNLSKNDKQKYVDLIVYYKDTITIIELNNHANSNYLRNVLYTLNSINNSYLESMNYYDKKVQGILVNLNWFDHNKERLLKGREEVIYEYPILGNNKPEYLLKIINVNLDYFSKICYDETKKSDKLWKLFTIREKSELEKITIDEKLLLNYGEKLNRLSQDEEYCRMMWDERLDETFRKIEAYDAGKEEGIEEKKKEMIINMYKKSIPIETIASCAEISIEEVKSIINSNGDLENLTH